MGFNNVKPFADSYLDQIMISIVVMYILWILLTPVGYC